MCREAGVLHQQLWNPSVSPDLVSRPPTFSNGEAHASSVTSIKALPEADYDQPDLAQSGRLAAFQES